MKLFLLLLALLVVLPGCGSKTKEDLYNEGVKQMDAANPAGAVVYFKNALDKDGNFLEARYQLGKAYAALGKNSQAEKEFAKVLTQNPSRDEVMLELARLSNAMGKGDQAFTMGQQYLSRHPGDAQGLEVLGISFVVRDRYQEARDYLVRALQADQKRPETKLYLADVYQALGDVQQARGMLNTLLQMQPDNFKALFKLAALEKVAGNTDKAVSLYEKILKLDPNRSEAIYKLGLIQVERKELDQANAAAERMIDRSPKNGDGYRLKGIVAFYRKDYAEAITLLQQSVKLSPNPDGYHFLGLSYYSKGEFENALSQFRFILDRMPSARQARLVMAQTLLAQQRTEDGIAEIKKVLAADESDAAAHAMLGTAYMSQGLFDQGVRELDRATRLDPKLVAAHLKKGAFYLSKGKGREGEVELAAAVQSAPNATGGRLLLASYYSREKNPAKAISVLQGGLKGVKSDAALYNAIAAVQLGSGNSGEGLKNLEQAKRVNPAFTASYQNLASYYAATGDYTRAIGEFNALLAKDPRNVRAMLGLAALNDLTGREAEALSFYRKAVQTKAPEAFLALAAYHQKKRADGKAIEVLDEAIKVSPSAVAPLDFKARIYLAQKDYRKALKVADDMELLNQERGLRLKIATYAAMGDRTKAIENARRLAAKRPGAADGHLLLASVYLNLGSVPEAIAEADQAVQADGKSADVRITQGNIYKAAKQYDKAQAAYLAAAKLRPDYAPAHTALAEILDAAGKKKEAAAKYRLALKYDAAYLPALNNLAYLCADGYGSKEEALRYSFEAYRIDPGNALVTDTLGYALYRNGRNADAAKVLERAAVLAPGNPTVRYHLALVYRQTGDLARSQKALQESLAMGEYPDRKAAQALLAQLRK